VWLTSCPEALTKYAQEHTESANSAMAMAVSRCDECAHIV